MILSPQRVFQVSAFTREASGGNPAGVVLDAQGLSDAQMRTMADTLDPPDTAFVLPAEQGGCDAQVRYLTPRRETTFVGHATVAAQYVRAKIEGLSSPRQRLMTGIGPVEIETLQADGDYRIAITQPAPVLGPMFSAQHHTAVFSALGLSGADVHPQFPLQLVAQKAPRLLIGVRSPDTLSALRPDFETLKRLSPEIGAEGYFVFALESGQPRAVTRARLFCPVMGIPEDPVSGNTHAMLGVYLVQHGLLAPQAGRMCFRGHQGAFVGRPGVVDVEVLCEANVPQAVRILGDAVITWSGVRSAD